MASWHPKVHFLFACSAQPKERSRNNMTPIKTRTWEAFIAEAAREQMGDMKPLEGQIRIDIQFIAKKHKGDLSNCIKSLEDALNRIAYVDDKQIEAINAERITLGTIGREDMIRVGLFIRVP